MYFGKYSRILVIIIVSCAIIFGSFFALQALWSKNWFFLLQDCTKAAGDLSRQLKKYKENNFGRLPSSLKDLEGEGYYPDCKIIYFGEANAIYDIIAFADPFQTDGPVIIIFSDLSVQYEAGDSLTKKLRARGKQISSKNFEFAK